MIYLDNNSTTKPFPEVVDVMTQFMMNRYWNVTSAYGQLDGMEETVESAKVAIRTLFGATSDDEIVFTSGATESNAWVVSEGARRAKGCGWVLSSQMEHPSISEPLENLSEQGVDVRFVPITRDGTFDLDKLLDLVDSDLCFASLMYAHNETGVIQPLREAVCLLREHAPQCLIHTDATQAIGKIPVSFFGDLCDVDLMSFSGHKFHGPKGIGGLVIKNGTNIQPLIRGGGQQNNLRSGTLNIPAVMGISKAAEISNNLIENRKHDDVRKIRDYFEECMLRSFPDAFILGKQASRLPNTSFFGIPGADADDLVHALASDGIVLSKGSSCSSQSLKPSETALSMEYSYDEATSLIRLSTSLDTTIDELDALLCKLGNYI
ncbi:MAG: cysteine desulfurase family protein [Candidatus Shapirobacteria bacterium]